MISRTISVTAAGAALVGGAVTLVGWFGRLPRLTDWDGDGIAMLPNTAVAASAASAALLLLLLPGAATRRPVRVAIGALAGLVAAIGGLTLSQHVFGWNLGIDTLLVEPAWGERAAVAPGRMGPPASMTFLLLGAALLLANAPVGSAARRWSAMIAVVATVPPIVTWTAYFYGADPLYSLPHLTGIARQTAAILVAVALALILAVREHGLGALLRRDDAAGTLVRRLLPISIVLLLVTGWLEDYGATRGIYDHAFGNAALTVVRVFMFTGLLWWTAQAVVAQIQRRQTLEAALSESQERFRVMVDVIPQLAWMARPDGWIYWYNRRWYEFTGMTPEDVEGWGWQSVHDPEHLPRVVERWKAAMASGEPWEDTFPLRAADGSWRWFLSRAHPIRDEQGGVTHWFGTNTDISDQHAAEDALRETNRIKDEFLAVLSHELRTPMSVILGWSQMLRTGAAREGLDPTGRVAQGLEIIERNARLQAQMIEDLLDMSRILSGKVRLDVQTVDLGTIVGAAVDSIRPAAEAKGLRLQSVCDPQIDNVRGDPARLQQVFYNLLSNAVKFTPKGGKVQVLCERVNSHVEFRVSDTGIGIKADFLPHMFERFRQQDATTTRAFGGLGLGLSITKQLVELHGGSIEVVSEGEGKGTTFTVSLPVSVALSPRPHVDLDGLGRRHPRAPDFSMSGPPIPARDQLAGIRALLVDDEPDARDMLRAMLEEHGARAIVASSAAEALKLMAKQPDVLLCDIGMPGMNGYELIRKVRELSPEEGGRTPAIALTAFARSEDRTRSLRAGFQMHLSKPVETEELLASIANLAGRAETA